MPPPPLGMDLTLIARLTRRWYWRGLLFAVRATGAGAAARGRDGAAFPAARLAMVDS